MSDAGGQDLLWWLLPPQDFILHTSGVSGGVTECLLAYTHPTGGLRVNGTQYSVAHWPLGAGRRGCVWGHRALPHRRTAQDLLPYLCVSHSLNQLTRD
jgi:hypothetical protein